MVVFLATTEQETSDLLYIFGLPVFKSERASKSVGVGVLVVTPRYSTFDNFRGVIANLLIVIDFSAIASWRRSDRRSVCVVLKYTSLLSDTQLETSFSDNRFSFFYKKTD